MRGWSSAGWPAPAPGLLPTIRSGKNGLHPKVAAVRLGHRKVGITLDLYSHVPPGMPADAAARVDEAYKVALQKRANPTKD